MKEPTRKVVDIDGMVTKVARSRQLWEERERLEHRFVTRMEALTRVLWIIALALAALVGVLIGGHHG